MAEYQKRFSSASAAALAVILAAWQSSGPSGRISCGGFLLNIYSVVLNFPGPATDTDRVPDIDTRAPRAMRGLPASASASQAQPSGRVRGMQPALPRDATDEGREEVAVKPYAKRAIPINTTAI